MPEEQVTLKKGAVDAEFKLWLSSIVSNSANYALVYLHSDDNLICRYDEATGDIMDTHGNAQINIHKTPFTYSLEKWTWEGVTMTVINFYDSTIDDEYAWVSFEIVRLLPVYRPETEFENLLQQN